ncbi:hypothetical protein ACP275_13G084300 [Erythranthe tilingii]
MEIGGQDNMVITIDNDRLSELPDSLLTHILSFLPTKLSVRSSILARRWRFLWTEVPTLDFDKEEEDFIASFISLHKLQTINTFRLTSNENYTFRYFNDAWFKAAIDRKVKNIDLSAFKAVMLPALLFTCKTLVDFRLDSYFVVPGMGCNVCLPCLKILHINSVIYKDGDETLVHLLSGCPVLEELVIGLVTNENLVPCNISSATLKRLTVHFTFFSHVTLFYKHHHRVEINTPALEYIRLVDCLSEHIKCGPLTSLTEADVYLHNAYKKQDDSRYSQSVLDFVDRLSSVKYLKLDLSYCTEIIDSVFSAWIVNFDNLIKLELTADCRFLTKILEKADNLEILVFWEVGEEIKGWMEPEQVPTSLLSNLRTIMLTNIVGTKHDFEIVSYLLMNAKVLEKIEIAYPLFLGSDEKACVVEEISSFERGSEACELSFVEFV